MNEYLAILIYAGFALVIFVIAMFWNKYRQFLKRKLRILHYHSDTDKAQHF
jgi:uncharacterized membrane protein YciS (DUF1049 family)